MQRRRSAAIDGAELDAAIERIAHVVGAETDDDLARTDAFGRQPPGELAVLPLEALLDDSGAFLRQQLVGRRVAGPAGVADDANAGATRRDAVRDLLQPEGVLRLLVGGLEQRRRARVEEQL